MGKSMGKYPPVNIQKAMENGSFMNELPIKMVIFHNCVKLPKGKFGISKKTMLR